MISAATLVSPQPPFTHGSMYGRTLPPDRNPYAESDGTPKLAFTKTVEYLSRAVELFGDFSSQPRVATTLSITMPRSALTEELVRYYQSSDGFCRDLFETGNLKLSDSDDMQVFEVTGRTSLRT